jgi:hypothetical protein
MIVSGNFHDAPRRDDTALPSYDSFLAKPIDIRAFLDGLQKNLGLIWIYDAAPPLVIAAAPQSLQRPAQKHLIDLLQLGRIGYVRGIEAKLAEIAQSEPGSAAFTNYLQEIVRGFELARFMAFLESLPELQDVE